MTYVYYVQCLAIGMVMDEYGHLQSECACMYVALQLVFEYRHYFNGRTSCQKVHNYRGSKLQR